MIDTLKIYNELKESLSDVAAMKVASAIGDVYFELSNMVTKTEFNELKEIVRELSEAQKRTEKELKELIGEHKKTREQIGGLTHTVGYILEDRAYKGLPTLLKRDFDIEVTEPIKRDFIEVSTDRYIEVNIIGKGIKDNKGIWIIGECKSQIKKADIDEFLKILKLIKDKVVGDKQLIAVTYQTSPQVRRYASEKGIKVYYSYELPL